jgi:hypothetical protein
MRYGVFSTALLRDGRQISAKQTTQVRRSISRQWGNGSELTRGVYPPRHRCLHTPHSEKPLTVSIAEGHRANGRRALSIASSLHSDRVQQLKKLFEYSQREAPYHMIPEAARGQAVVPALETDQYLTQGTRLA